MLLTIHNLPSNTRYVDVKSMLQEKCGLSELILDNLVSEGNTKKVTVGLADEGDAGILVRKINGLYINGLQLYVEDKRKKRDSDQPYRTSASLVQEYQESVAPQHSMGDMAATMNNSMMMNYNMASMYMPMPMMPIDQSMSYMGYGGYMAMPSTEPRPPANERGFGGFQGDGGPPGGRAREPPRDAPRERDRKRRASPDRPAENFNRPSRWNGPTDPPRREKSPPRHSWPAREAPRGPRAPPPERARDFDQYPPRPEQRRTDPEWQPAAPRWEDERRPPRAQAEPRWEPQPERAWQPEPEPEWHEPPAHAVENDNRRFNDWEGDFPPESEGNYPGPERFEPDDRRFHEEYPPAPREPEFRRPREQPDQRERRPRREEPWDAGNDRRDQSFAADHPGRAEPVWERPEEPHRPSRPSRPLHREPRPSPATRKERRDAQRPPPAKRPLPERERGPADWNQVANDYPPSKRPRENNFTPRAPKPKPHQEPAPKPPARRQPLTQSSLLEHKPKKVTQIINKDQTSRGQATAKLYKCILSGINTIKYQSPRMLLPGIVKELKTCIRSRIDVMLGEELTSQYQDIIERYRKKYPYKGDKALFHCMKDKVSQRLEKEEMDKGTGGNAATVKIEKSETDVKVKSETENVNAKKPKAEKEKPPRHAMTDKQIISEEKQMRKVEFTKKDHYKLDALTDKIVEEELAKISDIFAAECADPADDAEKVICSRIAKKSLDEFMQTARLHLAKRILDIRTGLAVRIFANGKLPRRCFIKEFLKAYRIDRMVLKKNKKGTMYVANVGSFEHYDKLCYLQNDVIDGTPVSIRSMYLVGPPPKLSKNQIKQRRKQFISSQVEPRQDFIIPPDPDTEKTENVNSQAESNQTESTGQPIEDTMADVNAETMEDFTADDFEGVDFSADNFEEDPNEDPESLNIEDIKEEDLEDF